VIEDALLGAKNILSLSEFSDESMLNEYNSLVDRINRDNSEYAVRFAERLERSKLRTGEIETVGVEYPFFHFPGFPQRAVENNEKAGNYSLKSNIMYYGSIASLTIFGLGVIKYYTDYSDYKSLSSTSPVLYYVAPELAPVLLASDQTKFKESYQKVESDAQLINSGFGIFGALLIFSHIDLLTTTKKVDTLGRMDGFPFDSSRKGTDRSKCQTPFFCSGSETYGNRNAVQYRVQLSILGENNETYKKYNYKNSIYLSGIVLPFL
jgi:hypothetical protein